MEERKQKEVEYYNRKAEEMTEKSLENIKGDFEGFEFHNLESWRFLKNCLGYFSYYSKKRY